MDNLLSAQQLADLAGVTTAAITQARQQGRIEGIQQGRNWFYHPSQADYLGHVQSSESSSLRDQLLLAKIRRESALASLAEIQLKREENAVVDQEEVIREWCDLLSKFRAKMMVIPSKMAMELSIVDDPRVIEHRLKTEIWQALRELAEDNFNEENAP